MKRFIWGIVLIALGAMSMAGNIQRVGAGTMNGAELPGAISAAVLFIVGGGLMAWFGRQYLVRRRTCAELALRMLRTDARVDAALLAARAGLAEIDVRSLLLDAQRRGLIPLKAELA